MSRIVHKPLNQAVYEQIRGLVLTGELRSGAQINEIALTTSLGVSRTPLREAIGQLVADGLVEDRPYRGKFVRTFSAKEIADLYSVRAVLEGYAVRLAAERLTAERIAQLRVILDDVQAAFEADDMAWYGRADRAFHETLASYCDNQTLIESLQRLASQIQIVRTTANKDSRVVWRTMIERPRMLAALEARDGELAARLMEVHIHGVCAAVLSGFDESEVAPVAS